MTTGEYLAGAIYIDTIPQIRTEGSHSGLVVIENYREIVFVLFSVKINCHIA
ncbi:MAG: hypothetical protein KHF84_01240 [Thermoplasmata archaeon]|nr:hypothetical protein [Candidatus Sysuiplasma jiujiangense]